MATSNILKWAIQYNPPLYYFVETVVPHANLAHEVKNQDEVVPTPFKLDEAHHHGSPSSRSRRLSQNMTKDAAYSWPDKTPVYPGLLLPEDTTLALLKTAPVVNCVVASTNTHQSPAFTSLEDPSQQYQMSPGMKDAMMGYPPGISDGGKSPFTNGPLNLDDEQRSQIIGRAFNAY